MWNIEYKGKLRGDIDSISSGEELPAGSVQFKEPETVGRAFLLGAAFVMPAGMLMFVLAVIRLVTAYPKPEEGLTAETVLNVMPALIVSMILLWPFMYVHEFIHAFLFPREAKKQIYVHPESWSLFVYCEDPISKARFITVCLGPAVILGLVPYITVMILAPVIPVAIMISVTAFALIEFCAALGDFVNAYNCIRQVPRDGRVFNHGYHSYWMK